MSRRMTIPGSGLAAELFMTKIRPRSAGRSMQVEVETFQLLVPYIRTDRTYSVVSTKLRIIIHNFTH